MHWVNSENCKCWFISKIVIYICIYKNYNDMSGQLLFYNSNTNLSRYIPHFVIGDLDSARPEVIDFYKNMVIYIY